jgi:hypothetical protein
MENVFICLHIDEDNSVERKKLMMGKRQGIIAKS